MTTMLPKILGQQSVKDAFKSLIGTPGNDFFPRTIEPIISKLKVEIGELQEDQTYTRTDACLFLNSEFADELDRSEQILNDSTSSPAAKADARVSKHQYDFLIIASLLNELGHHVYSHLGNLKASTVLVSTGQQFTLVADTISLVETRPIILPKMAEEAEGAELSKKTSHPDTTVLDPGQVIVVKVFDIIPEFETTKGSDVRHYIFRHSTELKNTDRTPKYPDTLLHDILKQMPTITKVLIATLIPYTDDVVRYHAYAYRRVGLSVLNRTHAGTFAKRGEEAEAALGAR